MPTCARKCFLVQLEEFVAPDEIFTEYAYFSSFSDSWVAHARRYCEAMSSRYALGPDSRVVEIASNDGYLLQHFAAMGIPVLGVEPAANVAQAAVAKGIPTVTKFFGAQSAAALRAEFGPADLLLGNNVLAHVPNLNDFVAGMKIFLADDGVITMEFPHLQQLMEHNQFDTIYHEHFSYFSFVTVERVFATHGLTLFDVEELPTHGGSLRIYARHESDASKPVGARVAALRAREIESRFETVEKYQRLRREGPGDQAADPRIPHQRKEKRQDHRRLRRAREGQHAAQLLWDPDRFPRFHRRPESLQAGEVHARHSHPDPGA
jgi:hypothetical protein